MKQWNATNNAFHEEQWQTMIQQEMERMQRANFWHFSLLCLVLTLLLIILIVTFWDRGMIAKDFWSIIILLTNHSRLSTPIQYGLSVMPPMSLKTDQQAYSAAKEKRDAERIIIWWRQRRWDLCHVPFFAFRSFFSWLTSHYEIIFVVYLIFQSCLLVRIIWF